MLPFESGVLGAVGEQLQLGLLQARGRDGGASDVAAREGAHAALLGDDGALHGRGGRPAPHRPGRHRTLGQLQLQPPLLGGRLLPHRQHVR